jgi:hypothetical protein
MSRRNIYLGSRVPDVGQPGLDQVAEVEGICREILEDYKRRRISYRTAMSRLNLLSLIVSRDADFDSIHPRKKARALRIIDEYRSKLMKMRHHRRS